MFLLPLLGVTALQMQSQSEVEAQLTAGVRTALADGWTLADVRGDDDEVTITMTKGDKIEQHVAHIDGKHDAYRVDISTSLPAHPWPNELVAITLAQGGGLEIAGHCGSLDVRMYEPGPRAKGAAAGRLVSAMLKAADDLETANVDDGRAVFGVTLEGRYAELHVALDSGRVIAAELRKYNYGPDHTTHTKHRALKRAIGKTVTRIDEGDAGPVLFGEKRFAIDYEAFEENDPDREHYCGC